MADVFEVWGGNGVDHTTISIGSGDYIGGSGSVALAPISQGTWQDTTVKTDAAMSANNGSIQNTKYVSPTEVSLNGAATVDLIIGNVSLLAMPLLWHYEDDTPTATSISDTLFFAYYGSVATPPSNVTIVAFERDGTPAIQKDSVSGVGRAWNASYGIGGIANALQCSDQGSAVDHDFYLGVSWSPSARGRNSNITIRLELNVT